MKISHQIYNWICTKQIDTKWISEKTFLPRLEIIQKLKHDSFTESDLQLLKTVGFEIAK